MSSALAFTVKNLLNEQMPSVDPHLFQLLLPQECPGLTKIRLGRDEDGGYIIPEEILQSTKTYVSFGVNNEDSFEMDVWKRTNSSAIFLCDPYIPYRRVGSPLKFIPIGLSYLLQGKLVPYPEFLKRFSIENAHIFLKVDIEYREYGAFECIGEEELKGIDCLVLELHGLLEQRMAPFIQTLLEKINKWFILFHLHGNTCGVYEVVAGKAYPNILECTFVNKLYLKEQGSIPEPLRTYLPCSLDKPNTLARKDHELSWWLNT